MSGDSHTPLDGLNRRNLFKILTAAGAIATSGSLTALTACSQSTNPERTELDLADLPLNERVRVMHQELPVEVIRTADGVTARSLWCTHMGCEVKWSDQRREYLCPCHEGVYNERGVPIKGPPPRPLSEIRIEVAEQRVLIGNLA